MIFQLYPCPSARSRLFTHSPYVPLGLEPEVNADLTANCPELECPRSRLQLTEYGGMLHLWRNPPTDCDAWIGFTSYRQLDKKDTVFQGEDKDTLSSLLSEYDVLSWGIYDVSVSWKKATRDGLRNGVDRPAASLALYSERAHPGINDYLSLGLKNVHAKETPKEYFSHRIAIFCNYWIVSKPNFSRFMAWSYPVVQWWLDHEKNLPTTREKRKSSHPRQWWQGGHIGYAIERLFQIWCFDQRLKVADVEFLPERGIVHPVDFSRPMAGRHDGLLESLTKIPGRLRKRLYAASVSQESLKPPSLPVAETEDRRMRLYTFYTPSHQRLKDEWFFPSLKDDYEVIVDFYPQECPTAHFNDPGWMKTMTRKIDLIIRAIRENPGRIFIHSDIDVQFLRPTQSILLDLMEDKDALFQKDFPGPRGALCAGFFVAKGKEEFLRLWLDIKRMCQKFPELTDQDALNSLLRDTRSYKIDWAYLPDSFFTPGNLPSNRGKGIWKPGCDFVIPEDVLMHHANWTEGVEHKLAQCQYVRRQFDKLNGLHTESASRAVLRSLHKVSAKADR